MDGIHRQSSVVSADLCGSVGATRRRAAINFARFDLVSIRLVVLCAQYGSLSNAAMEAHCAVSTASHRISAIEDSLGQALFVRTGRGMELTPAGAVFVQHGRQILAHLAQIDREFC